MGATGGVQHGWALHMLFERECVPVQSLSNTIRVPFSQ